MKKLLLGAAAALVLCSPAYAATLHNTVGARAYQAGDDTNRVSGPEMSSVPIDTAAAATVKLITGVSGQTIRLYAYNFVVGGTGNGTLVYGGGSLCATGLTKITGTYPLAAQAGITAGDGMGVLAEVPDGKDLCYVNSAAVQAGGLVTYKQAAFK